MAAQGLYTIVGPLPRGSQNLTVLALREDGPERKGVVLRPWVPGVATAQPPPMPGLVPVLGFDEIQGGQYALYEFSPGVTVREILEAFKATQRRAPLGLAGRIIVDAARVVSALHTGAQPQVHGSLHDGALLVSFDGTTRLLDVAAGRRSRFDAPEITRGEPPTARSDVYALAAMMHAASTGFSAPYATVAVRGAGSADLPPPSRHHADATAELDACLFRALTTNAAARAASVRLFADELERALGDKLFTRDQVGATLSELYGDRVAALKSLILRAAQDTEPPKAAQPPRPSRPRNPVQESPTQPRPPPAKPSRPSAPAVKTIPGSNIPVDTQAGQGGGIVIEQQKVLVEAEADPQTRPPRRLSNPSSPAVKRVSRPDQKAVMKPGPPVMEKEPVPLDDEAPPTGVEQAYKPPEDGGAISIGNDPDADGAALGDDDPNPTAIRPRAAPRNLPPPRPSAPGLKQQTDEERSMAAGQEKIDTADLDPENQGELASLRDDASEVDPEIEEVNTNVKARPRPPPGREPLEDPHTVLEPPPPALAGPPVLSPEDDSDDFTETQSKKASGKKKKGRGGLLFLLFLLVVGGLGGAAVKFRPWRGKPLPAWVPPQVAAFAIADGALPPEGAADPQMEVVQMTEDPAVTAEDTADGGAVAGEPSGAVAAAVPAVAAVAAVAAVDAGSVAPVIAAAGVAEAKADAGSAADGGTKGAPPHEDPKKKKQKKKR